MQVLLATQHVAVIYKPAGVPFHSEEGRDGVMQLARSQLPHLGQLYPVHRLDTVTSGALVLARSRGAATELMAQFRERRVSKYYVALTDRRPAKKMGTVAGGMQRARRGGWMLTRTTQHPAVTRFHSTGVVGSRPGLRAVLLKPETGRTHQLRVALKSLGAPVLGDARYGTSVAAAAEDRTYLHCAALRFFAGGEAVQVVCPPVEGLEFTSAPFKAVFSSWFSGLEEDKGVWFPESKLLRSAFVL